MTAGITVMSDSQQSSGYCALLTKFLVIATSAGVGAAVGGPIGSVLAATTAIGGIALAGGASAEPPAAPKKKKKKKARKKKQATANINEITASTDSIEVDGDEDDDQDEDELATSDFEDERKKEITLDASPSLEDEGSGVEDDDDGWQTRKAKPRKTRQEREENRQRAISAAQVKAMELIPRNGGNTTCVLLDGGLGVVATGVSGGLSRDKAKRRAERLFNKRLGATNQESGFGGDACAEPHAVFKAFEKGSLSSVRYSLAFDVNAGAFKSACGDCAKMLRENSITDLFDDRLNDQ